MQRLLPRNENRLKFYFCQISADFNAWQQFIPEIIKDVRSDFKSNS